MVMRYLLAILVLGLGACNTITATVTDPQTGYVIQLQCERTIFDTKIGHIAYKRTATGVEFQLDNYDSQSRAIELAREAMEVLKKVP